MSRPSESDLGWLAGIMDGEGTIALYSRPGKARDYLFAHFGFASTDASMITHAKDILQALIGEEDHIRVHPMPRKHINAKWKDAFQLRVEKQKQLYEVLTVLTPYLVVKKQNAEIVLEWVSSRLSLPYGRAVSEADKSLLARSRNVMNFSRSA